MRANIGVIFGGKSVEHEISIISAVEAMGYLDPNKYQVIPIYIDKEGNWWTGMHLKDILNYRDIALVKRYATKVALIKDGKRIVLQSLGLFKKNLYVIDLIMPVGHGSFMEDGSLQGYLNMLGVPYTGPGVLGAVLGQDKVYMKQILEFNKVPITNYIWFDNKKFETKKDGVLEQISNLKYPLYVKPSSLGSSIGITKVEEEKSLISAIKDAFKYDKRIIVEEAVKNVKEVNISVLGDSNKQEVSNIEEINTTGDFYSFKEKYVENYSKSVVKTKKTKPLLSKEMQEDLKKLAKDVFKILNARGVARIDFLINEKTNDIYVNEINTIPGSLSGYLWLEKKKPQTELLDDLVKIAINSHKEKDDLSLSLPGNLLEGYDILDGSKLKKKNNK